MNLKDYKKWTTFWYVAVGQIPQTSDDENAYSIKEIEVKRTTLPEAWLRDLRRIAEG